MNSPGSPSCFAQVWSWARRKLLDDNYDEEGPPDGGPEWIFGHNILVLGGAVPLLSNPIDRHPQAFSVQIWSRVRCVTAPPSPRRG